MSLGFWFFAFRSWSCGWVAAAKILRSNSVLYGTFVVVEIDVSLGFYFLRLRSRFSVAKSSNWVHVFIYVSQH